MADFVVMVCANRLECVLDEERRGYLKPMYAVSVPIVAADLLEIFVAARVDNLQLFPAVIRDPLSGEEHTEYYVFNVLGTVAAADMAAPDSTASRPAAGTRCACAHPPSGTAGASAARRDPRRRSSRDCVLDVVGLGRL